MANLGGTWPASFVMKLLGWMTPDVSSSSSSVSSETKSWFGGDPYELVQTVFTVLGLLWVLFLGPKVRKLAALPDDAWRTDLLEDENDETNGTNSGTKNQDRRTGGARKRANAKKKPSLINDMETGMDVRRWRQAKNDG
eukprot:CAMPEP_0116150132 /NCGR_PEP_ID=MMETSP0329-20121206/19364_1 /TAXON_ID=697910 /ORGANISM="Pseudo-nitzschia arenysensis, Strain B593" /LENGTH=138 /DNA_ID=CAMNT_0003646585 /DNA_START=516 /DNA_END=930 /DNA_ORIENTATION=+